MEALDKVGELDIDARVLSLFRVTIDKEFEGFSVITDAEFHKFFYNSFKQNDINDEVYDIMRGVCGCENDASQISLEKLGNFVSLYQVHPVLKRGDKNSSLVLQGVLRQQAAGVAPSAGMTRAKPLERDHDQVLWEEKVQGSTEQKNFRARMLAGGSISPVKEGGLAKYSSYCQTLTHGLPSGEGQDDKKMVKLKIAGGDMADVIENRFFK